MQRVHREIRSICDVSTTGAVASPYTASASYWHLRYSRVHRLYHAWYSVCIGRSASLPAALRLARSSSTLPFHLASLVQQAVRPRIQYKKRPYKTQRALQFRI
eukprot:3205831-Rhodomonas_salina.1